MDRMRIRKFTPKIIGAKYNSECESRTRGKTMTATLAPAVVSKSKRAMLIERLYREEGKAEIINGKVVRMSPAAPWRGHASNRIMMSLGRYEEQVGGGHAFGDNIGFLVELPH